MVVLRLVLAENVVVELVVEGIVLGVWGELLEGFAAVVDEHFQGFGFLLRV